MTLAELIAEVYTLTGRSDRVAETLSAVKAATLKAHQSDYYYKDIFEAGLDLDTASFVHEFEYKSLIPRWRSLKHLAKYDPVGGVVGPKFDIVIPDNVFDEYKVAKQNICYVAGAYLQIKSSTLDRYFEIGCYLNPDVTSTGYRSWVADDHPYFIIYDAAATVFKAIGKDEEAASYKNLVAEQLVLLRTSNILAEGF